MKRRDIISFAGGAATASLVVPLLARAQQPALPVVCFLGFTAPASELVTPFLEGLAKAGFSDGRNVAIQYRWAHDQADRLPALVTDLLRQQVAVIVTIGGTGGPGRDPLGTRRVRGRSGPGCDGARSQPQSSGR